MDLALVILLIVLIVVVAALAVLVVRALRTDDVTDVQLQGQVTSLVAAQQALIGQVETVTKNQLDSSRALTESFGKSQSEMTRALADRLGKVEAEMSKNLASSSKETAESLAGLKERLKTIDKAQDNIKALSEQVVSLQHVLDDNSARGAYGEMQLEGIVQGMLAPSQYGLQVMLRNGKQVDCLVELPYPPGPIAIDAKFPLKAYQAMIDAPDQAGRDAAAKQLAADTKKHIRDIAEKYVNQDVDGERSTAENAMMFLPSETVYAELHAHHQSVIDESHKRRVYLVSPTTLMATLTTVRAILRDAEMRKQATVIQQIVELMLRDVELLGERVAKLDTHFGRASQSIEDIKKSSNRIVSRGARIGNVELGETEDSLPVPDLDDTETPTLGVGDDESEANPDA